MDDNSRHPPNGTDWQCVIFGVSLGALAAFQFFKLPPVLPLLTETYGYGRVFSGGLMSAYSIAGLMLSWSVGRTCSRNGPRGLLLVAFGCFLAGNALTLAVPGNAPVLLGSRLLEGIGFTVMAIVGGVIATTSATGAHRMLATALWATWIPAGQIIGTTASIPAVAADAWRPLWWGALGLTLGVAAWGHLLSSSGRPALQKPAPGPAGEPDVPKAPPSATTPVSLLLIAALFAFWSMQFNSFMTWLPSYLVEIQGLGSALAAAAYLIPPVLIVAFNLLAGVLLRAGWSIKALLGYSLAAQAAVWYLAPWTTGAVAGVLSLATFGVTSGIIPTCLFALPSALPGRDISASRGFAAMMTGRNLGVLVGPVLLGQVITLHNGWRLATPLFGTICLVALGIHGLLSRKLVPHATGREPA